MLGVARIATGPTMSDNHSSSDESAFSATTGTHPATRPGMAPGTLGGGMGATAADNSFDLSLRLLTALVIAALAGSIALLAYRWLAPRLAQRNEGPVAERAAQAPTPAARPDAGPVHRDEVLMDPGHVFRCVEQGHVTFSDQACPGAAASTPAAPAAVPAPAGAANSP